MFLQISQDRFVVTMFWSLVNSVTKDLALVNPAVIDHVSCNLVKSAGGLLTNLNLPVAQVIDIDIYVSCATPFCSFYAILHTGHLFGICEPSLCMTLLFLVPRLATIRGLFSQIPVFLKRIRMERSS